MDTHHGQGHGLSSSGAGGGDGGPNGELDEKSFFGSGLFLEHGVFLFLAPHGGEAARQTNLQQSDR